MSNKFPTTMTALFKNVTISNQGCPFSSVRGIFLSPQAGC